MHTEGVNSKKEGCFGRKAKFFRESEDFAGNRETWEFYRETRSNEVKMSGKFGCFENVSPKIQEDIPDFREDFYLHMVLLKQHFLGLPFPVMHVQYRCVRMLISRWFILVK